MNREELENYLYYDPDDGSMTSAITGHTYKGVNSSGYKTCYAGKKSLLVHRVAFILMGEELPDYVDHINGDRTDNRWENLRPCSISENSCNRGEQTNSKTGVKNVYPHSDGGYFVQVRVAGKVHHIGKYPTVERAKAAAIKARSELHGTFSHKEGVYQ